MTKRRTLPPFAGRCHVQLLRGTAAQAADTAAHLATFRSLSPITLGQAHQLTPAQQRAGVERWFGGMLAGMALLLALASVACRPARITRDAERATPSKNTFTTAPMGDKSAWPND